MDELTTGLIVFVAFMAFGLSVIPVDTWLERRRAHRVTRRYYQAHPKRR